MYIVSKTLVTVNLILQNSDLGLVKQIKYTANVLSKLKLANTQFDCYERTKDMLKQ